MYYQIYSIWPADEHRQLSSKTQEVKTYTHAPTLTKPEKHKKVSQATKEITLPFDISRQTGDRSASAGSEKYPRQECPPTCETHIDATMTQWLNVSDVHAIKANEFEGWTPSNPAHTFPCLFLFRSCFHSDFAFISHHPSPTHPGRFEG
ncbi:uncharacterized protein LOC144079027 [Stigmatopora argus]